MKGDNKYRSSQSFGIRIRNAYSVFTKQCGRIVVFACLLLALPFIVEAQPHTSISIKASATVVERSEIEMITIKNIELDESKAVNGVIHIQALTDPQVGIMVVKGKPNATFRINYLPELILNNTRGLGSLTIKYEVNGFPEDNQGASEPLDAVERTLRFNQLGFYYLWVGGLIDISNGRPGNYDGEFTVAIEYI